MSCHPEPAHFSHTLLYNAIRGRMFWLLLHIFPGCPQSPQTVTDFVLDLLQMAPILICHWRRN